MDAIENAEGATESQYLSFRVSGEDYAVSVLKVKEILEYDTLTEVPDTPPSVRGVINLRGSVVPVVDLALKFSLPETKVTKLTCVVIVEANLEGERTVMGVMVDAVSQVIEFPLDGIEEPPSFGVGARVDYLLGMGKAGKKFVLILDIDKILSAEELRTVSSIQKTAERPISKVGDQSSQGEAAAV